MPPTASLVLPISCLISVSAALSAEASPEKVNVTSAMSGQVFESVIEGSCFTRFFLASVAPIGACSFANPSSVRILQSSAQRHPQDVFFAPPRRSCNCENQRCHERGVCAFGEVGESGSGIGSALALWIAARSAARDVVMPRSSAGLMLMANAVAFKPT